MNEVAPRLWRWTAPHPEWSPEHEWGHEVASFALESSDVLVLVDPQAPPEAPFWTELDRLCDRCTALALMVTIPYHVRSSSAIYDRYRGRTSVSVWGHAAARRRLAGLGAPVELVAPGKPLPAGAQAFAIGSPRRQEMPLYFPAHRALAFGDAVVGVEGELRVWETPERGRTPWYKNRFLPTLRPLLELDIDHVLVTHGPPAIGDGKAQLERALSSAPWHYR
jgi:glyoxylase-like metal-dependent hydrolase (beta-lactamase superfamily II)